MIYRFTQQESVTLQTKSSTYDPGHLLDRLREKMRLKQDSALAKALKIDKLLILNIRERRVQISGSMLLLMQEVSGISVDDLRSMLKDRRRKSRMEGVPRFPLVRK